MGSILLWSLVLLILVMMMLSMFIGNALVPFMRDLDIQADVRESIYEDWGSFLRALISMFAVTVANWAPYCQRLMNHVDPSWGIFFILYKCTVGFAVVQVISSVFIQQTFKVAGQNDTVMINEKLKSSRAVLKSMENLFQRLDESGDGILTREEWTHMM